MLNLMCGQKINNEILQTKFVVGGSAETAERTPVFLPKQQHIR